MLGQPPRPPAINIAAAIGAKGFDSDDVLTLDLPRRRFHRVAHPCGKVAGKRTGNRPCVGYRRADVRQANRATRVAPTTEILIRQGRIANAGGVEVCVT